LLQRLVGERPCGAYKSSVVNRLKTVRGHLDGVIRMVEAEEYCVDLMKQVSALQASLERANRVILQLLELGPRRARSRGDRRAARRP